MTTSSTDHLVDCKICMKEVPVSEAKSEEASDYVMYFCGLDCFDQWRRQDDDHAPSATIAKPVTAPKSTSP